MSQEEEKKGLAVTFVKVHGADVYVLLDLHATPNVVSPRTVKQLALKIERIKKVVTMADGEKSSVLEKVMDFLLLFGQLEARID